MKKLVAVVTALMSMAGASHAALTWTTQDIDLGTRPGNSQMHGTALVNVGAKKFLYMVGGNTAGDGGDTRKIRYFEVSGSTVVASGTCTWESPVNNLIYVTRSSVGYNGRLYVAGGRFNSGGATYNGIRVFTPEPSGDITAITQEFDGTPYSPLLDRLEMAMVIKDSNVSPSTSGVLYIAGGGGSNAIQRAYINKATGFVEAPVTQVATMGAGLTSAMAVVHNGYLYVIGGSPATNVVRYFQILPNDDLGPENIAMAPLPENRFDGGAVSYNGTIYQLLGCVTGNTDTRNTVYRATLSGPAISSWTLDTPRPVTPGARRLGAVADSEGIYTIAGRLDGSNFSNKIDVAREVPASVADWSLY